jgi:hypothetical protein
MKSEINRSRDNHENSSMGAGFGRTDLVLDGVNGDVVPPVEVVGEHRHRCLAGGGGVEERMVGADAR